MESNLAKYVDNTNAELQRALEEFKLKNPSPKKPVRSSSSQSPSSPTNIPKRYKSAPPAVSPSLPQK
jgi:hypothetical protein